MKDLIKPILLIYFIVHSISVNAQTSIVRVKIINAPYLLIERYMFFKYDKEIQIEKTSDNNYTLTYYGKTPKLYSLNLNDILISPGDSIDLIYNRTNTDLNTPSDTIIAKGKNSGNYTFSIFITPMKPLNSYPDYKLSKYQNNFYLLAKTLDDSNKKDIELLGDMLKKHTNNNELIGYLKRKMRFNFFYDLLYFKNKYHQNPTQRKVAEKLIDSVFMKTVYVKSDTSYGYFMELTFKNYFDKILLPKFNNIKLESDFKAIVNYIANYPDPFVGAYFTYFLSSDHNSKMAKYESSAFDELVKINPHIGKERNQILNIENIFK